MYTGHNVKDVSRQSRFRGIKKKKIKDFITSALRLAKILPNLKKPEQIFCKMLKKL